MGRPSQGMRDGYTPIRITIPPELDAALESLVKLTGTSKRSLIRRALYAGLAPYGLVHPELAEALPATRHSGVHGKAVQ